MRLNIRAGMRVLYKCGNSGWLVGEIMEGQVDINHAGLFIPMIPKEYIGYKDEIPEIHYAEINDIFLDAAPLDESIKMYKEYFMTKDGYINFIESDEFEKNIENAYFSDGEYIYYPVSKYSKSWIEKQPFDYIVRGS